MNKKKSITATTVIHYFSFLASASCCNPRSSIISDIVDCIGPSVDRVGPLHRSAYSRFPMITIICSTRSFDFVVTFWTVWIRIEWLETSNKEKFAIYLPHLPWLDVDAIIVWPRSGCGCAFASWQSSCNCRECSKRNYHFHFERASAYICLQTQPQSHCWRPEKHNDNL